MEHTRFDYVLHDRLLEPNYTVNNPIILFRRQIASIASI